MDDWRGGENYIECVFVVAEEKKKDTEEEEDEWSEVKMGFIWEGKVDGKLRSRAEMTRLRLGFNLEEFEVTFLREVIF